MTTTPILDSDIWRMRNALRRFRAWIGCNDPVARVIRRNARREVIYHLNRLRLRRMGMRPPGSFALH